jgi:hypothetical protein
MGATLLGKPANRKVEDNDNKTQAGGSLTVAADGAKCSLYIELPRRCQLFHANCMFRLSQLPSRLVTTQSPCTLPYGKNKDKRFIVKTVAFM